LKREVLEHPNVLKLLDVFEDERFFYLVPRRVTYLKKHLFSTLKGKRVKIKSRNFGEKQHLSNEKTFPW